MIHRVKMRAIERRSLISAVKDLLDQGQISLSNAHHLQGLTPAEQNKQLNAARLLSDESFDRLLTLPSEHQDKILDRLRSLPL